jgi:predicted thioesterase
MALEAGLVGEVRRIVDGSNTGFPVLGTPAIVGMFEEAGMAAIAGALGPSDGTVGTHLDVKHLAPTPLGEEVRATATLVTVDGRRLVFALKATDAVRTIAEGEMERFVVDVARFVSKALTRA